FISSPAWYGPWLLSGPGSRLCWNGAMGSNLHSEEDLRKFGIRAHPPPPSLPHSQRSLAVCHLGSLGRWDLRALACGRSSCVDGCGSPRWHSCAVVWVLLTCVR